jgi:hypothetical protein
MGDWADMALRNWRGLGGGRAQKRPPTVVQCRYCDKRDLRWGQKKGGFWQVRHKDGTVHECPEMIQDRLGRPVE